MSNQKRNETNTLDQKCQTQYIAFEPKSAGARTHTQEALEVYGIFFMADNSTYICIYNTYVLTLRYNDDDFSQLTFAHCYLCD